MSDEKALVLTVQMSEQIDQIFAALAAAQVELSAPSKNRVARVKTKSGYEYKYNYADLPAIIEAAKPIGKQGIGYTQIPYNDGDNIGVITILGHKSGQWIRGTIAAKPDTERLAAVQAAGSIITFLRRYSLACMLGIAAEDDDDGNAAGGNIATTETKASEPAVQTVKHATLSSPRADAAAPVSTVANERSEAAPKEPYTLEPPRTTKQAIAWADVFIRHIQEKPISKSRIGEWVTRNQEVLEKMRNQTPSIHERVIAAWETALKDPHAQE